MNNLYHRIVLVATSFVFILGIWPQIIETIFYLMSLGMETPPGSHGGSAG